jgi:hypothetical protein
MRELIAEREWLAVFLLPTYSPEVPLGRSRMAREPAQ